MTEELILKEEERIYYTCGIAGCDYTSKDKVKVEEHMHLHNLVENHPYEFIVSDSNPCLDKVRVLKKDSMSCGFGGTGSHARGYSIYRGFNDDFYANEDRCWAETMKDYRLATKDEKKVISENLLSIIENLISYNLGVDYE